MRFAEPSAKFTIRMVRSGEYFAVGVVYRAKSLPAAIKNLLLCLSSIAALIDPAVQCRCAPHHPSAHLHSLSHAPTIHF
jgi:hypothetical protein